MILARTILAVIVGVLVGGALNMLLVEFGPHVVPPPAGVDVRDLDSIAASIDRFRPAHFVFPFLAHALGTFAGALTANLLAARHRRVAAWVVAALFFGGGIAAAIMIPAPGWFIAADLALAYAPMALLAIALGFWVRPESF